MDALFTLEPEAAALVDAPDVDRARFIDQDTWVLTPTAKAALQWMEYLRRSRRSMRPTCLQIIGDTGMGKSAICQAFAAMHPARSTSDPLRMERPVLLTEATDERGVFGLRRAILEAAWPGARRFDCTKAEVDETLRCQAVLVLLIDELGEILRCTGRAHQDVLTEIRRISSVWGINIVGATVTSLQHALQMDEQLASRFKKIILARWTLSQDLRNFVFALERKLPFPKRSELYEATHLPSLAMHSNGQTKELLRLIRFAAMFAIDRKARCIEAEDIKAAIDPDNPPAIALQV
jgi:hypothetical protein